MRLRAVALLAAVVAALAGSSAVARAANELRYGLRLEGGGEYDSNPARREQVEGSATPTEVTAATALRLVSALDLALLTGGGHLFSVAVEGAGKRFLDPVVQDEDLLRGRRAARRGLRARRSATGWRLQVAHYDAFQRAQTLPEARDFRSTSPSLRFEHRRRPGAVRGRRRLALVRVQARAQLRLPGAHRASCPTGSRCRRRWRSPAPSGTGG